MSMESTVRRFVLWILVLAVAGTAVGFYIRRNNSHAEEKYRTEPVERGVVSETVTATGTISAVTTVQVGSQVSGIISRLHVDFNSPVKGGQLLAELDPTPFEAQVEQRRADVMQAEVQMRSAEISFRRQERLLAEGLSAQADFDAAKAGFDGASAQVDQARAALRQSLTNLQYTKILSPIDGVVVDRQYDVGQTVAASFQAPTLFTIAQDLTKMQVQAEVDQSDIGRIRVGQLARFSVDAYPDEDFRGTIAQIRLNATVNQNVITYPVILAVANPDEKLRPKMTANVTIEVRTVKDVLRIPNAALRFRPAEGLEASAERTRGTGSSPEASRPGFEQASPRRDRSRGLAGAAGALQGAVTVERTPKRQQTVYVLEGRGALTPLSLRTGISDGRFTAVLEGDLKAGQRVVVGLATSKVETGARLPGGGGGRGF